MENVKIDRRAFIKGGAALGLGTVAAGALTYPQESYAATGTDETINEGGITYEELEDFYNRPMNYEIAPDPIDEDLITDTVEAEVVIIGGGMSGSVLACSATESGVDVVVVSASANPVGRGGSNAALGSKYMRELGIPAGADNEDVLRLFRIEHAMSLYRVDGSKWGIFLQNSEEYMDWLIDHMAEAGYMPYIENHSDPADGMHKAPLLTHGFWNENERDGYMNGAPRQAKVLCDKAESLGARFYWNTHALQLVRDDEGQGRVSAVIAEDADGNLTKFVGTKAVVLATGDFTKNREMMARHAKEALKDYGNAITWDELNWDEGFTWTGLYPGEGHQMALWAGAAWQKNDQCAVMGLSGMGMKFAAWPDPYAVTLNVNGERFQDNDLVANALFVNVAAMAPKGKIYGIWAADFDEKCLMIT